MDRNTWLIVGLEIFLCGFGLAGIVNGYIFAGALVALISGYVAFYTLLDAFTAPAPEVLEDGE